MTPAPDTAALADLAKDLLETFTDNYDEWPIVIFQGRRVHIDNVLKYAADALAASAAREERMRADLAATAGFVAIHAVKWARDFGLPEGVLHSTHYDILASTGCLMESFTRHETRSALSQEAETPPPTTRGG